MRPFLLGLWACDCLEINVLIGWPSDNAFFLTTDIFLRLMNTMEKALCFPSRNDRIANYGFLFCFLLSFKEASSFTISIFTFLERF